MIEPFTIAIPQADLDDLADRLARTRWPDELPDAGWDYGIPLARMKELTEHWRTAYDWRKQEARLNELPQYTTEIDGQRIHFVHVRSANPEALPLILTHGWPGSFLEFLGVIRPLAENFHLVIPSIPGFGFSGPTHDQGWDIHRVARAWAELMNRLGYDRYGAQGGDFGSGIARALANVAPDQVVGVHVTYLPLPPPKGVEFDLDEEDTRRVDRIKAMMANRPAYQALQATRPQTISYALTDSPIGQLAWIAEKFTEWTDPASEIPIDHLLTNVTLYWLTGTAGSSARLTKESAGTTPPVCAAPLAVAVLPHDITLAIRPHVEHSFQVAQWTEFEHGGHFAAVEVPDLFAADVTRFFQLLGH
ncbi:pimeloyl-ACP methyl ester carboxylesterase [Kribbella orskensis]|uniref:Pimeloyl-ACP methyl ester carboxylesterase n=1 Tax=Kribbella orskensis TaxID=2512216 RepID=A0ABY2BG54_9ACTN|nr:MULTISPECIES: epoxide hydrolase family protein [Kribbella]TCN37484.1 pimeloyl-ACP methyl ester carboxylesterase [Kribbella sp. VKM Ac-2500]TCO19014.1 pimeloyl-ACP methyl ester carboxylesterase [Kribbella orskensis]